MKEPVSVLRIYRIREGLEAPAEVLLKKHWATLRDHDLVTESPAQVYYGREPNGGAYYLELFTWLSESAARKAGALPDVRELWGGFEGLTEARDGRAGMEFLHGQRITMPYGY